MKSETLFFIMDKQEIAFLRFLLEAYEGIAILSTLNREKALLMLSVAPGCMDMVREILASFESSGGFFFLEEEELSAMGLSTELCI